MTFATGLSIVTKQKQTTRIKKYSYEGARYASMIISRVGENALRSMLEKNEMHEVGALPREWMEPLFEPEMASALDWRVATA